MGSIYLRSDVQRAQVGMTQITIENVELKTSEWKTVVNMSSLTKPCNEAAHQRCQSRNGVGHRAQSGNTRITVLNVEMDRVLPSDSNESKVDDINVFIISHLGPGV